jgi:hypothetical protein
MRDASLPLPNFLVLGAAKAGTTSLWNYLHQHPQIFLAPVKEPRFFAYAEESFRFTGPGDDKWNRDIVSHWEDYQVLFQTAGSFRAVGESSNVYLYMAAKAAPRIAARLPRAKLFAVLRQPVDRAYSHFLMMRREGREPIADFRQALHEEERRLASGWSPDWAYMRRGLYADSIQAYLDLFPRNQIHFYLHDDFLANPLRLLAEMFAVLGVDRFVPDLAQKHNVAAAPRSRRLAFVLHNRNPLSRLLRWFLPMSLRVSINRALRSANMTPPEPLSAEVRDQLLPMFQEDIERTAALIGRDLSPWLRPGSDRDQTGGIR